MIMLNGFYRMKRKSQRSTQSLKIFTKDFYEIDENRNADTEIHAQLMDNVYIHGKMRSNQQNFKYET